MKTDITIHGAPWMMMLIFVLYCISMWLLCMTNSHTQVLLLTQMKQKIELTACQKLVEIDFSGQSRKTNPARDLVTNREKHLVGPVFDIATMYKHRCSK
jgi:hypothetical protein